MGISDFIETLREIWKDTRNDSFRRIYPTEFAECSSIHSGLESARSSCASMVTHGKAPNINIFCNESGCRNRMKLILKRIDLPLEKTVRYQGWTPEKGYDYIFSPEKGYFLKDCDPNLVEEQIFVTSHECQLLQRPLSTEKPNR